MRGDEKKSLGRLDLDATWPGSFDFFFKSIQKLFSTRAGRFLFRLNLAKKTTTITTTTTTRRIETGIPTKCFQKDKRLFSLSLSLAFFLVFTVPA